MSAKSDGYTPSPVVKTQSETPVPESQPSVDSIPTVETPPAEETTEQKPVEDASTIPPTE